MFGIFLSAINASLAWVFRSVLVKFGVFFALYFVVAGFIEVLSSAGILPSASALNSAFGGIPASVWYFLDLFNFTGGLPLVASAWATRFIIRRIPVIG